MQNKKTILLDCMETLIDLHHLPTLQDYAAWAYCGSGAEELWKDFDEFFRYYISAKQELSERLPQHAEYEMKERFQLLVRLSLPGLPWKAVESTTELLYNNYWRNYRAECFVREDVRTVVPELKKQFRLGVVSNFMIMGGIEELLESHGLLQHFEFVVTSVAEGWRKPHRSIYSKALELADTTPNQIVFVGDDVTNDYEAPLKLGLQAICLDRENRHQDVAVRVKDFYELLDIVGRKELL